MKGISVVSEPVGLRVVKVKVVESIACRTFDSDASTLCLAGKALDLEAFEASPDCLGVDGGNHSTCKVHFTVNGVGKADVYQVNLEGYSHLDFSAAQMTA